MAISVINQSQRKAARIAGFAFLFAMTIVVIANYGISFRLIVPGDAVETARNIMAHKLLFRINIACDLIYVVDVIVLLAALYAIFETLNRNFALVATVCRLVYALMWGFIALNLLGALRLLGDAAYLPVFDADQLQSLARLQIATTFDAYYVGLPFWGLASMVCSYLWFNSRYIPRSLAAFGMISSTWCVICAFAYLISPNFENTVGRSWFDIPMVIFELTIGLWLLFKGLESPLVAKPN